MEAIVVKRREELRKNIGLTFLQVPEELLIKSNDDDYLEKGGGPGSRGGKVVGYDKSGKPIYEDNLHEHEPGEVKYKSTSEQLHKLADKHAEKAGKIQDHIDKHGSVDGTYSSGKAKYSREDADFAGDRYTNLRAHANEAEEQEEENSKEVKKSTDFYTEDNIIQFSQDLEKAFNSGDIDQDEFEKAIKDITKLQKKIITNKDGFQQTVYVRQHEDGTEHHFKTGDKVKFEHEGKERSGLIMKLKHHEKFDKFGTAEIHDHSDKGEDGKSKVYSKSLRAIEHHGNEEPNHLENNKKTLKIIEKQIKDHESGKDKLSDNDYKIAKHQLETTKKIIKKLSEKEHHTTPEKEEEKGEYISTENLLSRSNSELKGLILKGTFNGKSGTFVSIRHDPEFTKTKLRAIFQDDNEEDKPGMASGSQVVIHGDNASFEEPKDNKAKKETKPTKEQEEKSFDNKIQDFADSNWDAAWSICKEHGKTKGMSKQGIKQSRPGYVAMWLEDLHKAKKLSTEQINKIKGDDIKKSIQYFTEDQILDKANNLQKALDSEDISNDYFEKAVKDLTQLQKKLITNKDGHQQTVYVRIHDDKTEHHFTHGDSVKFEHNGVSHTGTIKGLKSHPKYDKFGTAEIHDEKGNKYSKSLRQIEHHVTPSEFSDTEGSEERNVKPEKNYGKSIGETESGKEIFENKHPNDYEDFDTQDHKDAYKVHNRRGNYYDTKPGGAKNEKNDETRDWHYKQADLHLKASKPATTETKDTQGGESKVIGKTKSGKKIYDQFDHPAHKDFDKEDHEDARKANNDFNEKNVGSNGPNKFKENSLDHYLKSKEKEESKPKDNKKVIVSTKKPIGYTISEIGAGGKEHNVKTVEGEKPKLEGIEAINHKQKQLREIEDKIKNHTTGVKKLSDEDLTNAHSKAKLLKIIIKKLADKAGVDLKKSNNK